MLKACANRLTGTHKLNHNFSLLLQDLNITFLNKIMPMILPLMSSFGLMILGKAGIGKTLAAQIMTMAVARHITSSRNLSGLPGWRRSRQIDGFRELPGEINIPALLDDQLIQHQSWGPQILLDVGKNCLVDARSELRSSPGTNAASSSTTSGMSQRSQRIPSCHRLSGINSRNISDRAEEGGESAPASWRQRSSVSARWM